MIAPVSRYRRFRWEADDESEVRARIVRPLDRFVDIRALAIWPVELLHKLEVDILVDLTSYQGSRPEILRHLRPRCSQLYGNPGTMGADFIDYIMPTRRYCRSTSSLFHGKIVHLPVHRIGLVTPKRTYGASPSRREALLPNLVLFFCCSITTGKLRRRCSMSGCGWLRTCGLHYALTACFGTPPLIAVFSKLTLH